jgi:hypothetical protein
VIKSVRVEAPEITFELGAGGNNLSKILANVEAATGGKSAPAEAAPGKKLQVDEFLITGAKVRVGATALGGTAPILLPEIRLSNLGTGPDGITAADLTQQVLKVLTDAAVKAAAGAVGEIGKGTVDAAKDIGKTATETVGGAAKGITDIFKKKQ